MNLDLRVSPFLDNSIAKVAESKTLLLINAKSKMYQGNFTISISSNDLVINTDQQLNIDWEACPIPMQALQAAVLTSRELLSVVVSLDHLCCHCVKKVNLVPGVNKVKCTSCGRNMSSNNLRKSITFNMDLNVGDKSAQILQGPDHYV